jgi:hypothetical protein
MSQNTTEAVIAAPAVPPATVLTAVQLPPIMTSVCTMINASCLGTPGSCFIDNAWDVLLAMAPQARTRDQWKAPAGVGGRPAMDSCRYLPTDPDRVGYVRDGLAKLKKASFYGVCNDYAWVVASMLAATKYPPPLKAYGALLPLGVRVEVYGIVGNQDAKHMFVVVGRALGSTAGDTQTWGPGCFVVDQWYALQTGTQPVKCLDPNSAHYDAAFVTWWGNTVPGSKRNAFKELIPNRFAAQMDFRTGEFRPEF